MENPWTYDRFDNVLTIRAPNGNMLYEVDLDRCKTANQTLDWIVQVSQKGGWATPEVVGNLVMALDEHLRLQATQCGMSM